MIQTSFFPQPEKDKPVKIIQINSSGLQPRKVEELLPNDNILPDTYMIYPEGGYHPFYGVPNTLPRYQEKIWPYVKRIKFNEKYTSEKSLYNIRTSNLREPHLEAFNTTGQCMPYISENYCILTLAKNEFYIGEGITKDGTYRKKKEHCRKKETMHKLVALAFIPNLENKPQVLHLNDDSTNYIIINLKWGTESENMRGTVRKRPDTMEQKYLNLVDKGIIKG